MLFNIRTLRWIAWIGLALVLVAEFIAALPWKPRQGYGVVLLVFMLICVVAVAAVLMPGATGSLLRHTDLLVPFALLIIALQIIDWLAALPLLAAVFTPSLPLRLFNVSVSLSLTLLLNSALCVAYGTWVTAAILAFVGTGQDDPCAAWPCIPKHFWRVLGFEFICVAALLLAGGLALPLIPLAGWFGLLPIAAIGVAWNFSTAALLPLAIESQTGFWKVFQAGIRVSLANLHKWWLLLLAHMLLMGLIIFFYSRSHGSTNVSWHVTAFWTGGYDDNCRWYEKLAATYKTSTMPWVSTALTLLFGAMAVAMKIAIVQRWKQNGTSPSATESAGPLTA